MSKSRDLGNYGTAALADTQSSPTDTTAGSLMAVGAFGLGSDVDLRNTIYSTGTPDGLIGKGYAIGLGSGSALGVVVTGVGTLEVAGVYGGTGVHSGFTRRFTSQGRTFVQSGNSGSAWGDWNEVITANAAGNVGIGTSSPSAKLELSDPSAVYALFGVPTNGLKMYIDASGAQLGTNAAQPLRFITSNSERMRINSAGYLGIGTSSPLYGLDLDSSANNNLAARFKHSGLNDQQYGIRVETADDQNDNTRYFFNARGATTTRLTIYSTGDVKNSNNSYGALSDQKLKENIADSASQWNDLKAVRLRNYSMISDGEVNANRLGVIAQELEAAGMGGLVSEHDDLDENNESLGTTTKSVKYSILYLKAVGALQEAQTRIESLEELTQSLITRIEILEAK